MTTALYQNEKSALTVMREALVWNVRQIQQANGYKNTVGLVMTEMPSDGDLTEFPAVALVRGETDVENEDQSDQFWHKRMPYLAVCYCRAEDDPTLARETLLMDLERRLFGHPDDRGGWMLQGEDGVESCRIATLEGDRPFGMWLNKPQVGFVLRFSVRLAQDIHDPTVAG